MVAPLNPKFLPFFRSTGSVQVCYPGHLQPGCDSGKGIDGAKTPLQAGKMRPPENGTAQGHHRGSWAAIKPVPQRAPASRSTTKNVVRPRSFSNSQNLAKFFLQGFGECVPLCSSKATTTRHPGGTGQRETPP